jgi:hypothetical protein
MSLASSRRPPKKLSQGLNSALCLRMLMAILKVIAHWWFSIFLLLVYVGIFNLWLVADRQWIILSGLLATVFAGGTLIRAARQKYFVNRWDKLFHALVILDILLEAILIRAHDNHGFYFCALGFAVAIGGYRHSVFVQRD